jgi:hypothetical protein
MLYGISPDALYPIRPESRAALSGPSNSACLPGCCFGYARKVERAGRGELLRGRSCPPGRVSPWQVKNTGWPTSRTLAGAENPPRRIVCGSGAIENEPWKQATVGNPYVFLLLIVISFARGCYAFFLLGCWRIVGILYESVPAASQIGEIRSSL